MSETMFLKLGGSLITDKTRPFTVRNNLLADLSVQIAQTLKTQKDVRLILGHGSGSFGHTPARQFKTRDGIPQHAEDKSQDQYWRGFLEVGYQAATLNRFVMDALHAAGVRALAISPLASLTARNRKVAHWDLTNLRAALDLGLVPVIYGDIIFDQILGGTIFSTEDLFMHLAEELNPDRILLAGLENGVWADFPARTRILESITPASYPGIRSGLGEAAGFDVTGGMTSKIESMLALVQKKNHLQIQIFSGEQPGAISQALQGAHLGTVLLA